MPDDFASEEYEGTTAALPAQPLVHLPHPSSRLFDFQEEVLAQIFLLLSRDTSTTWIPTLYLKDHEEWDWVCVTEVCRYWYGVATGTSKLWSFLDIETLINTKRTRRFLFLSKNADLTVYYPDNYKIDIRSISLEMTLKELSRIRHLSLNLSFNKGKELILLLDGPAPRLQEINLTFSIFPITSRFSFPVTSPGVLKKVKVCLPVSFTSMSRLSQLTSLSIIHCKNLLLLELFEVLETSPNLSSLSIIACDIRPSTMSKPVYLPCLTHANFEFTNFSNLYDVLSNIKAPNLSFLRVCCPETITVNTLARLDVFLKLLRRECDLDGVSISISNSVFRDPLLIQIRMSNTGTEEATLELSFNPADIDVALRYLIDMFSPHIEILENLRIKDPEDLITEDTWRAVLRVSSRVRNLDMDLRRANDDRGGEMRCLKALSPIRVGEDDEVPCRALDQLLIKWNDQDRESRLDLLLSVLENVLAERSRHGVAVRVLSVTSRYPPRNDEQLTALSQWVQKMQWTS